MNLPISFFQTLGLLFGLGSSLLAADADAPTGADPTILTVDMKKLFESHPKTIEAEKKINEERNQSKNDGQAEKLDKASRLSQEIVKLNDSLKTDKLDPAAFERRRKLRDQTAATLKALDEEIRDLQQARERELQEKSMKLRAEIVDAIMKAITAMPALSEAAFLFDTSGLSTNGVPVVTYSNPKLDRTGAVLKLIGAGNAAEDPAPANAGKGLGFAVVDMKRVFEKYFKTKESEGKIESIGTTARKELEEFLRDAKNLAEEVRKLDAELAKPALSGEERKRMEKERATKAAPLQTLERNTREFQASREKRLQDESARLQKEIVDDIYRIIVEGVKANGHVDLIFDSSGSSLNGVSFLPRADGIPDWTDAVIAALNSSQAGAKRVPAGKVNGSVSTSGLRFGVIDFMRIFGAVPSTKEAVKALSDAKLKAASAFLAGANRDAKDKEVQDLSIKMRAEIVDKISQTLAVTAAKASCHVVFDAGGPTLNGVPVVIVHKAVPDFSSEIITTLGGKPE